METARSSADIRHANALTCIHVLRSSDGPLTITDLAQGTGLSRPTVDAVISELESSGTVTEVPADSSGATGGRPARRFRFQASNALVAGVDAGPTRISVLVADLSGNVVGRAHRDVLDTPRAAQRVDAVVQTVRDALAAAGAPAAKLRSACVGVSGIIGLDGKIAQSYFVPEWNNTDLARRLSTNLGCHVFLENDTKLAAYAVHHYGPAQLASDVLYFHLGRRLAFAFTIDGRIHQGAHRSAGELASLRGMRWTTNSLKGELTWSTADSVEGVLSRAVSGDVKAKAEWDQFISEVATRIATVALVIDPDLIVIGGELVASESSETFMDMLRAEVRRLILLDGKPEVVASSIGAEGTLFGALALGFQESSYQLFGLEDVPVPDIVIDIKGHSPASKKNLVMQ